MKQKQRSAVTTGGGLPAARTRRWGTAAANWTVCEHAINQLSSDLDQEKTGEGRGGATTQTWKTWKCGPTQVERILQGSGEPHLHRICPGTSHQSLLSAPAVFSFTPIVFQGGAGTLLDGIQPAAARDCFTDASFMGPLKTREEPPPLRFCCTWAEGTKGKEGREPCCSCQEVNPLGCCIIPPSAMDERTFSPRGRSRRPPARQLNIDAFVYMHADVDGTEGYRSQPVLR